MKKNEREEIKSIIKSRIPEANIVIAKVMFVLSLIGIIFWRLLKTGALSSNNDFFISLLLVFTSCFLTLSIYVQKNKGIGESVKYLLFFFIFAFLLVADIITGYNSKMYLLFPIILSLRYYDKTFTKIVFLSSIVFNFISIIMNAYFYNVFGYIDINTVYFNEPITINVSGFITDNIISLAPDSYNIFINSLILDFVPNIIILIICFIIVLYIMEQNINIYVQVEKEAKKEAEYELQLQDMSTKLMLSQIQPHFMFNSLSSIAMLCTLDPKKAKNTVLTFTKYLRSNINALSSKAPIPFEEELNHVKAYLEIESIRFGSRLRIKYDINTTDFVIPPLTLQPIVENAVKHGVCKKEDGGTILISTNEDEDKVYITVEDDGVGFDVSKIDLNSPKHVGIMNVSNRLKIQVNGALTYTSFVGKGTVMKISMSKEKR